MPPFRPILAALRYHVPWPEHCLTFRTFIPRIYINAEACGRGEAA